MVASVASTVHGIIVADGRRFSVELKPELLIVDAKAWFVRQIERHVALGRAAERDGDKDFANEMREVADQVAALIEAGRPLRQTGMWPQIHNRSLMQPWAVDDDADSRRAFALRLVEFGTTSDSGDPCFLLRCHEGIGELVATERLRAQALFSSPFATKIVQASDLRRRLEELV